MNTTLSDHSDPFRIILIDDEPSVLHALSLLLKAIGYECITFSQPAEAIAFFQSEERKKYQLILCDLRMPEFDGMAVLAARTEQCPELPFVLMSGHATSSDVEQAIGNGAAGFLAKPFTPDQIHEIVAELKG
ncbi:MAG: response regulator [Bdellovibrionales bacterium]|nr:response regulator [Bdellovibrionales bacterium]